MDGTLILDRYRPLEELGAGGFGTVVLAWDTRMQRRVAIKRLDLPLDSRGLPEIPPGLPEARTAAMLAHPSIVTVHDFDTDSDEAFLVMEYVDGAPLDAVLDVAQGPLTPDETAAVVEAVAGALEFAHDNGVLHLDIKPSNVLVARDGRVKVADFGMAELSTLTGHGSAWGGTPAYAPPEQLSGGHVDERTDVWALALLAYESLTATNPFEAARGRHAGEPPAPSELVPGLPAELDVVLSEGLSDAPGLRHPSAQALSDDLAAFLGDPAAGRASLAGLVAELLGEEPDDDPGLADVGLWDRLAGGRGAPLVRLVAAAESGWLAWAGLAPLALETPARVGAIALIAAGGALAPQLGIVLGAGCVVIGAAAVGSPLAAGIIALLAGAWWWFIARRSPGAAVLPLAAPVLASARLAPAQPFIAGFAVRPAQAAVSGLVGGALVMLASAATLHGAPYLAVAPSLAADPWGTGVATGSIRTLLASPAAWTALAGWPAAAALVSLACARATRLSALLGVALGAGAFGGAYALAAQVARWTGSPDGAAWTGTGFLVTSGASLILMLVVVALGAPLRPEEEPPRRRHASED